MRILRISVVFLVLAVVAPTTAAATYFYLQGWPASWSSADWSSTNTAPDPGTDREAIIQVYAARTGRWKGVLAVHSWIAVKPVNAPRFHRFDVVGWRRNVVRNGYPVDGRWYSNAPRVVHEIRGPRAEALIPRIEAAVARYPYDVNYKVWPGPNSNTFIAWLAREVPDLELEMPATAVGKDYIGEGLAMAPTPSGTGWQVSWNGYVGLGLSVVEGLELHLLGTTIGIDPQSLGIKLPGFGLVSMRSIWGGA